MTFRQVTLAAAVAVWCAAAGHASPGTEDARTFTRERLCKLIDAAAAAYELPSPFLTRLIWQESAFRISAVSPKGAQGVAQFMPGTAGERGLADPFDPEQAIPASASFLSELSGEFGNLGLAAAAYNAGPRRISDWLSGRGGLPHETRHYVQSITGLAAEDWRSAESALAAVIQQEADCLETVAPLGRPRPQFATARPAPFWGVRADRFAAYSANARSEALAERLVRRVGRAAPAGASPTTGAVRAARAPSSADGLCASLKKAGGACASARRY